MPVRPPPCITATPPRAAARRPLQISAVLYIPLLKGRIFSAEDPFWNKKSLDVGVAEVGMRSSSSPQGSLVAALQGTGGAGGGGGGLAPHVACTRACTTLPGLPQPICRCPTPLPAVFQVFQRHGL